MKQVVRISGDDIPSLKTSPIASSVLVLSAFLALTLATIALGQETAVHGRVVGVTDGDTLKVLLSDQKLFRIRLAFCDTAWWVVQTETGQNIFGSDLK